MRRIRNSPHTLRGLASPPPLFAGAMPPAIPSSTTSAPRGAADFDVAPLRDGQLPDQHAHEAFRFSRKAWLALGCYDKWLSGATLKTTGGRGGEVPEDCIGLWEECSPNCKADYVTCIH